ncbi:RNA polymerase sigma factor [Pseudobacter ginsenosidimutans]|uniref:RNA polymerase sigma-70 factor (ECF subfamily) n=1 Tax=Pseudobacter ginsenosidimutans TaxID=661488 RepID=A0A4Q7MUZ2_9BACT|nr:sigma-70 family RNA polymerase sigma factor [Pseudobacter ginsenosidimutans]QEC40541.1 sigma-70 family RNA polymerase sigma factor [Pseudobacter ginsenosidimutans]RZS72746.1 RNA polymerase sigma-70 factor (ECF subfamily) [Pseudobacter ginsenosidimutans]
MITSYTPYENYSILHAEEKAFNELVTLYTPDLLTVISGITKCRYVAEDILQDTFLKLWSRRETLACENPGGWLYRVAVHAAYKYLHKESRRTRALQDLTAGSKPVCIPAADNRMISKEQQCQLELIFTRLPQMQKKVFWLSREGGLSRAEIAGKLNISCNTVRVHLTRAQRFFKAQLSAVSLFLFFFGFAIFCANASNTKSVIKDLDSTEENVYEISSTHITSFTEEQQRIINYT